MQVENIGIFICFSDLKKYKIKKSPKFCIEYFFDYNYGENIISFYSTKIKKW
jgi:hypothetical protein